MTRRRSKARRRRLEGRRQPTGTYLAATILVVFLVMVFFAGPAELPRFFQRLVGFANALLAMLVMVFAIREFGKRVNRFRVPGLGRLSTSKLAGAAVFALVLAWWLSPWAPIHAG